MSLTLPPRSLIRPGTEMADAVHRELTAVVAGHPGAVTTYTFYERLDEWLGPWGEHGYPIAYGKFYNILFSQHPLLRNDPHVSAWLWRTTILLQEMLRDYVVQRVRAGTIHLLTEADLRTAAFDTHPQAYTRGGLATVVLVAPELVPIITCIPGAEFSPTAANFSATVQQVFITAGMVAPRMMVTLAAASAGFAHNGALRVAAMRDRREMLAETALVRELASLELAIERGEADYIPALDRLIASLEAREFPDQGFARRAREVVEIAKQRRRVVRERLRSMLEVSPEVRRLVERHHPEYRH